MTRAGGGFRAMGMGEAGASRVRYVEPAADGRVQIVLDETRQRIVSGRLDDQKIQALLIAAAKDPSDPGLRAETVDILTSRAQSADVRDALVFALQQDENAGVRMKAMEGVETVRERAGSAHGADARAAERRESGAADAGDRSADGEREFECRSQCGSPDCGNAAGTDAARRAAGLCSGAGRHVLEAVNASAETY